MNVGQLKDNNVFTPDTRLTQCRHLNIDSIIQFAISQRLRIGTYQCSPVRRVCNRQTIRVCLHVTQKMRIEGVVTPPTECCVAVDCRLF